MTTADVSHAEYLATHDALMIEAYTKDSRAVLVWLDWLKEHGFDGLVAGVERAMVAWEEGDGLQLLAYCSLWERVGNLCRRLYGRYVMDLDVSRDEDPSHHQFYYTLDRTIEREHQLGTILEAVGWVVSWTDDDSDVLMS